MNMGRLLNGKMFSYNSMLLLSMFIITVVAAGTVGNQRIQRRTMRSRRSRVTRVFVPVVPTIKDITSQNLTMRRVSSFLKLKEIAGVSSVSQKMRVAVRQYSHEEREAIIQRIANDFGGWNKSTRDEISQVLATATSPTATSTESHLKHLDNVKNIYKMLYDDMINHFQVTQDSLMIKKESLNESGKNWFFRVKKKHTKLYEKEALIALYDNTNGSKWNNQENNWKTDTDICEWIGVTCNEQGRVTELRLLNSNLSGSIPTEIGQLTNLNWLNLRHNKLTGSIPKEIGQLTNLEGLYLYNNNLSGSIPSEIGQLTNLKYLWLSDTKLSGPIPSEIGQLTRLISLDLRNNNLSDTLPYGIRQLLPRNVRILAKGNSHMLSFLFN